MFGKGRNWNFCSNWKLNMFPFGNQIANTTFERKGI